MAWYDILGGAPLVSSMYKKRTGAPRRVLDALSLSPFQATRDHNKALKREAQSRATNQVSSQPTIENTAIKNTNSNSPHTNSNSPPALDYLYEQARDLLSRDRARFANSNYPAYTGRTTTPMSTLTQRGMALREQYGQKPAPYSGKIQSVLARDNEGIKQDDIQRLLGDLSQSQRGFAQNAISGTLQNRLGYNFAPRAGNFSNTLAADADAMRPEVESRLGDIARVNRNLEGSRNRSIANTLQSLQQDKLARRQSLISNLEQFGAQKHAYGNMVNAANRGLFENEARAPYAKMSMLENAMANASRGSSGNEEEGIEGPGAPELGRAIKAYNTVSEPYKGRLVSPLPAEILASQNVLERLTPSLRGDNYDTRKRLTRELMDNPTVAGRALQNLPAAMQGQVSMLDKQAKERLERDLEGINAKYIKLNQYGSRQHMVDAERRAKEISQSALEQRSRILQESLRNQLQSQHENDLTNINQLGQIGNQGQRDFAGTIFSLRDLNQQGAGKFENEQDENAELYRNYQNENLWQWPHMRAQARNEGANAATSNIFGGLGERGISLDRLAELNTRYSTQEKEMADLRGQFGGMQQQLLSAQQARDELQRQLGLQRSQEQQRQAQWQQQQAAEQARQRQAQEAQRQAQEAERARLEQMQRQANPYANLNHVERAFRDADYRRQMEQDLFDRSRSLSSVPPSMDIITTLRDRAYAKGLYSDDWRRYAEMLNYQYM